MSVPTRDPHSGHETTGHEWNGITELNTPVPKVAWGAYFVFTIAAVILWVLYPTWPLGETYTEGVLGADQRDSVEQQLTLVQDIREGQEAVIAAGSFAALQSDTSAMDYVHTAGARLYADNCAMCHGSGGEGAKGFPSLVDDQWLWGGTPDDIMETLRVGINTEHPETRVSEMLAFGRLGILSYEERRDLANYVHSLSSGESSVTAAKAGVMFETQCSACHGQDGKGVQAVGAPNLTDPFWIYGGSVGDIQLTLRDGRQGVMPNWNERLSETERKLLTLYILDLGAD